MGLNGWDTISTDPEPTTKRQRWCLHRYRISDEEIATLDKHTAWQKIAECIAAREKQEQQRTQWEGLWGAERE